MINGIKETMKNNKWDHEYSERDLTISENGIIVKHCGTEVIKMNYFGQNWIRSVMPIPTIFKLRVKKPPIIFGQNWFRYIIQISSKFNLKNNIKPSIAFYYEVEICKKNRSSGIVIGFNGPRPRYQMNYIESLGEVPNTIGIWRKRGMAIHDSISSIFTRFENVNGNSDFNEGDVVGMGIIIWPANSIMYCFATFNGKLLGKAKLPAEFVNLLLFPAPNLYYAGESIRVNFGKEEWCFKQFNEVLQ